MAHRVSSTSGLNLIGSQGYFQLKATTYRIQRPNATQVRTLWWWRRHGKDWSSWLDEHAEERLRRHQKIMKYRYSKAIRRRAMWERDDNLGSSWQWQIPGRWFGARQNEHMSTSSGEQSRTDPHNQRTSPEELRRTHQAFHKDFESFKAAIDRAVDRDPYGAIFGRRIQSPPSANNSSWTSFSWIFDPKEIKGEKTDQFVAKSEDVEDSRQSYMQSQKQHQIPRHSSYGNDDAQPPNFPKQGLANAEEYEFDPISMRKVRKTTSEAIEAATKKPLLKMLFSEHGTEIPVKTYKPHKVYGFGAGEKDVNKATSIPAGTSESTKSRFESSRKRELKSLMAATLGNNIDTTAEYGGKYVGKDVISEDVPSLKKTRNYPEPRNDAPLFSGTAYEARSAEITEPANMKTNWLLKEGFATPVNETAQASERASGNIDIPVKTFKKFDAQKQHAQVVNREGSLKPAVKLQTSLDRRFSQSDLDIEKNERTFEPKNARQSIHGDNMAEDIDLLRASDVRAATKSARRTSYDVEKAKSKTRESLEADYAFRQNEEEKITENYPDSVPISSDKLTNSLNALWKHVREYPQGIVARTMQSVGTLNESFKKFTRPYSPDPASDQQNTSVDRRQDNRPPITKNMSKNPATSLDMTSSKEVLDAELAIKERRLALQRATEETRRKQELDNLNASALAFELRKTYESHYGNIDVHHRQSTYLTPILQDVLNPQITSQIKVDDNRSHPLMTATISPNIDRNFFAESHTKIFEPKYAKIVDGAKEVRREAHEIKQKFKAIQSRRPATYWQTSNGRDPVASGIKADTILPSSRPEGSISSATGKLADEVPEEKPRVTEPVPSTSNSGQLFDLLPTSPYIILSRDHVTGKIDVSQRPSTTEAESIKSVNPVEILARLNHASEYLKHFSLLEAGSYEMVGGSSDQLVFKKAMPAVEVKDTGSEPASKSVSVEKPESQAATVLDQLPAEIDPVPGPAAPTAPPTSSRIRTPTNQSRVRRQEKVFSGTRRPIPANTSSSSTYSDISHPSSSEPEQPRETKKTETHDQTFGSQDSLWTRIKRRTRRVFLTVLALGGTAYAIGFVAEGMDAQTQQRRGSLNLVGDEVQYGPRKKIVMTGQRPGIFSTESSR